MGLFTGLGTGGHFAAVSRAFNESDQHRSNSFALLASATALCLHAAAANDVPFDDLWQRFRAMSPNVMPLLDSPAGWHVLSIDLGAPLPISIH